MTIDEKQHEIIADFEVFDDWTSKYEYIIDLGKELKPLDEIYKTEGNLVKGCQSRVWLHAYVKDNQLFFDADSDAIITKGLVGLMVRILSGHTPNEIAQADLFFIDQIGLKAHLSPNRSNGLVSMIQKMKAYALLHLKS
jgi:cysteine desulfuration protein SufE